MSRSFTWLPLFTLTWRELVRFYRQPSRIVGALGSPLVFWFLLGSGLGNSFQSPEAPGSGYLQYFFPGTLVMVLLFTSIFSTISVIEDRKEGFLQSVLVAPVSRAGLVGGKVLGGTLLSLLQGIFFLFLAPLAGFSLTLSGVFSLIVTLFLLALSLTSLSFLFAWRLNSVQGFHGVMNLVLFPMWLLSGALFPLTGAPKWLSLVMGLNPLTYGVALVKNALYQGQGEAVMTGPLSFSMSYLATIVFALLFYAVAMVMVGLRPKESFA